MRPRTETFGAVCLLALLVGTAGPERAPRPAGPVSRRVVVAELFTSEGCSSCPPADAVFSDLMSRQPFDGVEVVGLGEHVDYWDRLGWRDPYSSPVLTRRQAEYDERVFGSNRIYTPQIVVDGQFECLGSDAKAVGRAILAAAERPKAAVLIEPGAVRDGAVSVVVHVDASAIAGRLETADMLVALTEDRLVSRVQRGENGGRTLTHDGVVRTIVTAGAIGPTDRQATSSVRLAIDPRAQTPALRIVAFVQERRSRRILGAAAVPVRAQ